MQTAKPSSPLDSLSSILKMTLSELEQKRHTLIGGLGLDSLDVTQLRSCLSPKPSYQTLYGLTIAELADKIAANKIEAPQGSPLSTEKAELQTAFPLTPMQESYLIGANQGCPCQVYTEFDAEDLDLAIFRQAISLVVDTTPMLHAYIVNGTQQSIQPAHAQREISSLAVEDNCARVRQECLAAAKQNPNWYWDIRLSRVDNKTVRIHLLVDMLFVDASSVVQICQDISSHYRSLRQHGVPANIAQSPRLFSDYCRQISQRRPSSDTLSYWQNRIDSIPNAPQLPRLHKNDEGGVLFQRESLHLDTQIWGRLKEQASSLHITASSLLLTAFAEVLRLYSEEPAFSLAVTMSERPMTPNNDFSAVIGEFTNILLCPISSQAMSFPERALAVHQELSAGLEHNDLSGLNLVRMLRKHRSDQHLSFPIVFTSFMGIVRKEIDFDGSSIKLHYQQTQTPQIALDAQVYEINGQLQVNWDYDRTYFSPDLIKDIMGVYSKYLLALSSDLTCVPKLQSEVLVLRSAMNQTQQNFPSILLHELVLAAAEKTPDAIAVIDHDVHITYRELVSLAQSVCVHLQEAGVQPKSCVAIVMEKGWEQVVATIGILMNGGFYLPLNPSHPDERIRHIIALSDCSFALVQDKTTQGGRSWFKAADGRSTKTIRVHRGLSIETAHRTPTFPRISPEDLAYVIFTSGSTGDPKGVEIDHRGAANTCMDINQRFGLKTDTRTFAISSLSFDLSVWDIFGTLGAGGAIVMCGPNSTRDPDYWWEQLRAHKITVWNTVPTSFEMLLAAHTPNTPCPLKVVLLSGDAIQMSMVNRAHEQFPDLKIVALGGATEASIWSNFHVVTPHSRDLGTELVPYGKALSNQTMWVLDRQLNARPAYVAGDIYIGGIGLARGYFRDEGLTKAKFIESSPYGRLYATGDLGRYLKNGEIEILGRKDSQVKVGGHRVELGEIERCAESLKSVQRAIVVHLPGAGGRLVGFVVLKIKDAAWQKAMQELIESQLPDYMHPQAWYALDAIPLTANAKVDSKKLRQLAMVTANDQHENSDTHAENQTITTVLNLVAQILGVSPEPLSPSRSLIEQGLSSLYAVQFINLLADTWKTRLPYTLVFNYPSAVQIAEYLETHRPQDKTLTESNSPHAKETDGKEDFFNEPIAVIGAACRLPGGVNNLEQFWHMLREGRDCVTDVPSARFDMNDIYDPNPEALGRSYTRRGAFLDKVDHFDYEFFGIPTAEARAMDPQQRMLLELSYEAFYAAGFDKESLRGSSTGIFVGQMNYDWMMHFPYTKEYAGTGSAPSISSNRISFILDLAGPSMTIDTACSSSLVAVDTAMTYLRTGSCDMALAAGINLILSPEPYLTTCQARMLSVDSRCATFDAAANGIARGEGAGAVVLKRLSQAQADGDTILAVLRGSAVNQDGRSASLTAPNGRAQETVIKRALRIAGLEGKDIDYVECHGTGTPLGDPIELEALKNVLGAQREKPLVLGSVKTNIGHLEGAAGIIGLLKAITVLSHRVAPGNVHFKSLNPKIDLQGFAAVIPTRPIALGYLDDKTPLHASISSFGYGGTNAHVVLQSWETPTKALRSGAELFRALPLPWAQAPSAQTKSSLTQDTARSAQSSSTQTQVEDCLYELKWVDAPLAPSQEPQSSNSISSSGLVLSLGPVSAPLPTGWHSALVTDPTSLKTLLSFASPSFLLVLGTNSQNDVELGLSVLQSIASGQKTTVIFVTAPHSTYDAGLWGLARSFRLERPEICTLCIECEPALLSAALTATADYPDENEFKFSSDKKLSVARLQASVSGAKNVAGTVIRPDRTYVISGGLGALGLVVAQLLVKQGARKILLLSRRPSDQAESKLSALRQHAEAAFLSCDVSLENSVKSAQLWLQKNAWPAVAGVVHTAGLLTDALIQNQTPDMLQLTYAAKVHGAEHLRSVFGPKDFFIIFSSVAAVLGAAGQSSYAAANASVDALACLWAARGENVIAIQWGPWSDAGMAVDSKAIARLEAAGFGAISNELGCSLIKHVLATRKTGSLCFSPFEVEKLSQYKIFAEHQGSSARVKAAVSKWDRSSLEELVRTCIEQFLPMSVFDDDKSFIDSGFSSLDLVQLRQQLLLKLPEGLDLPVHFAFNYPNAKEITDYLFEQLKEQIRPTAIEKQYVEKQSISWTRLNKKTTGTPLFLVGGVMGSVEKTFGELAAAMECPVYGIMPAIPATLASTTLESIAKDLLDAMLLEVKSPKYALSGMSFGAALAFEMGLQSEVNGLEVDVVLLDPRHLPPFTAPSDAAPFELLVQGYRPKARLKAQAYLFQCTIPPLEKQSEMMQEASRSFQDDKTILEICRHICTRLELISTPGHHFNFLFKHCKPIAAYLNPLLNPTLQQVADQGARTHQGDDIAIVGMACRLPNGVDSVDAFWDMLMAGTDCVSDIPLSRFDIDEVFDPHPDAIGKSYTRRGAFMQGVEYFDYPFFGLSAAEARVMDPQQRVMLETAYAAFASAGYDKEKLRSSATSVHIGLANDDWATMGRDQEASNPYFGAGVSGSIMSNRISYLLGLTGPSMTIDTACSSSLVAVDLAVKDLQTGTSSLALVGGVNVILHHRMFVSACATKALSPKGRCATFDASADGYCRGEGAGAIVLKRLREAEAAGDHIYAVIRGTAVNQDGRSVSMTAPNGRAQEAVLRKAISTARLQGHDIDYVECHGTGTPLGDPIELAALKGVLNEKRVKNLVLGAVKTNIGHLEGAAGIVGLIKAVLVVSQRKAPAITHFTTLNPHIDLKNFPTVIPTSHYLFEQDTKLAAGVSSFGFGGTNAHVVLQSYPKTDRTPPKPIRYEQHFLPWKRLPHPLLSRRDEHGFVAKLQGSHADMWKDHAFEEVVIPGAGHMTMLAGAALLSMDPRASGIEVHDIVMSRPVVLNSPDISLHCIVEAQRCHIKNSRDGIDEESASCRARALLKKPLHTSLHKELTGIRQRCEPMPVAPLYTELQQAGVNFGSQYRNVRELFLGEHEVLARIEVQINSVQEKSLTLLHPATLDAGLQILGFWGLKQSGICVPFRVQKAQFSVLEAQPIALWAHARIRRCDQYGIEGSVTLFDEKGDVFACLEGVECRNRTGDARVDDCLFTTEWVQAHAVDKASPRSLPYLVLSRTELDIALPNTWQSKIVKNENQLAFLLNTGSIRDVLVVGSNEEEDVILGLKVLQQAEALKSITFVTAPGSVFDAGLWGLAKSFRLENGNLRVRCLRCDKVDLIKTMEAIIPYVDEDDFAFTSAQGLTVPRLMPVLNTHETAKIASRIRPDASYVISGGLGALGIVSAQFLVEQGATHVLLLGRKIVESQALSALRLRAKIECLSCDVSQVESVRLARQWLQSQQWPRVAGVIHTAGELSDATIPNQSPEKIRTAFAAKVHGAINLRAVLQAQDFMVLFSSAAATFGSPGQASYAAANASLDALSEQWSEAGEHVLSIQWGAWSQVGMAVRNDAVKRAHSQGFGSISNARGKAVLSYLLASKRHGAVCVSPLDMPRFKLDMSLVLLLRSAKSATARAVSMAENEAKIRPTLQADELLDIVRHAAREAMGRSVEDDDPLMASGLDSLGAVVLAQILSQKLELTLSSVFALNYPSIAEMAVQLGKQLANATALPATPKQEPLTPTIAPSLKGDEPIAIVGMACRLPGDVSSPQEFWDMLMAGKDCISDIPASRFDIDEFYDENAEAVGRSYTRRGGFMKTVEFFDHEFFGIPANEAKAMDPHQRLLLEVSYEAFHNAGYDKKSLKGSATSVFVGVANQDWGIVQFEQGEEAIRNPYFGTGVSSSIISNRISHSLGLNGPSMTIDTACSSSLVAIDLAVEKLRSGVCSKALVGGVNVMLHHRTYVGCCAAKMLSPKGRCATFDESADGYCRGEGVGAVVLKRLSEAQADGDAILAVIRGTAVNQDGRSGALTAPNGPAQEAVIQRALANAQLKGSDIDYVECHGTGTLLGDPVEVDALKNVLSIRREKPVVLGAVKTNIGHLEGAAGVVGLIKAVLVLRHREAPGNAHFKNLNPKIDLKGFFALIPSKPMALGSSTRGEVCAGVSSFGFGGTNAHVIVSSYEPNETTRILDPLRFSRRFLPWRRLPHPLLLAKTADKFTALLHGENAALWSEHRFDGKALVPAASHISMLAGAAMLASKEQQAIGTEVTDLIFSRPLTVDDDHAKIHCQLGKESGTVSVDSPTGSYEVASCSSWRLMEALERKEAKFSLAEIRQACEPVAIQDLYEQLWQKGAHFGTHYRNITDLHIGENEALAKIKVTFSSAREQALTLLQPIALDAGIQLMALCGMKGERICIPFSIQSAKLFTLMEQPRELWAYAVIGARSPNHVEGTVTLFDEKGSIFAVLSGLNCRTPGAALPHTNDMMFKSEWTALAATQSAHKPETIPQCLVISSQALAGPVPAHWERLAVESLENLAYTLVVNHSSTIVFVSDGTEKAVSVGLRILQLLTGSQTVKSVVFVTAPTNTDDAGLWGLARSARMENLGFQIVCLSCSMEDLVRGVKASARHVDERELSITSRGETLALRLHRHTPVSASHPLSLPSAATYLISGGTGGLGLVSAHVLLRHGAKHILLLSRRCAQSDGLERLQAEARKVSARVELVACDVAEEESVLHVKTWLSAQSWPDVAGIIHTAGSLTDATLPNQSPEKMALAYAAKVHGAKHLRAQFSPKEFFVSFSSATAVFGSAGQSSYAAANATLDALTTAWSAQGEPALSIQWGAWSEAGMAARNGAVARAEATGFGAISSEHGASVLVQVLAAQQYGCVCVSPIDWKRLQLDIPLLADLRPQSSTNPSSVPTMPTTSSVPKASVLSAEDVRTQVRRAVADAVGRTLTDDEPLMANGLDSLGAVGLTQALNQIFKLQLNSVFTLNYPTIRAMVENLQPLLVSKPIPAPNLDGADKKPNNEPIAIVSMACHMPGNVNSPEDFWEMLLAGTNGIVEIPKSRFDIDEVYDPNPASVGKSYTRHAGFMQEVESFDYEFFGISVAEARMMDPQQRLLLETTFEALHHAGFDKESLRNSPIGVFIGQMNHDWAHLNGDEQLADPYFGSGSSASIMSNRISYLLGLTGPSMTIDTACSSSLVAVDLAIEKLRNGSCRAAIAGGVNVILHPRTFVGCCAAKMLSRAGRCATFDESADGYCRGEGVGVVVLKRLSDAQADGDTIHAVIRGSAVNQDGRSASLTAPNGLAQEAVIKRALEIAGIEGRDVDYIECHGTGTVLGDPIEIGALKNVLGPNRSKNLVLGAVKTNIGHLEGAAGIAGLIKAVLVLRSQQAPGNLHFKTLNPKIDLGTFPAIIPRKTTRFDSKNKRLVAGVSSFGFGGTNAHVVLESWNS